jgi:regulator of protease activity HflC (stomatin/prohibitin superfamily)
MKQPLPQMKNKRNEVNIMPGIVTVLIILALIVLIVLISGIKFVPQAQVYIVERFGAFHATLQTGPHYVVPIIDKVAKKVSIKEQVADFKPQPVITKDNVTMQIDTVVFFQITDAKLYTYGVERPMSAIENLTATTLRNIIGEMELDATLSSRDVINTKITSLLDVATDPWGIKVNRVELKNILPPREIQDAMERQMKAERERREKILQAEGEKKSQILVAEGEKESKILRAEAEKQAAILKAEAEKQALILRSDAVKQQKILEAQGEAESIELVQSALADSLVKLNNSNPSDNVIALKSLEAFGKAADGKATKIIIPSEIQGLAGLATSVKEIVAGESKETSTK